MQASPPGLKTFSSDSPQTKRAEFTVGIASQPYLADHGFADMIVLPGSFYITLALQHYRDNFAKVPRVLRNIRFQSPLILSREDIVIQSKFERRDNECVVCVFFGPSSREISAERNRPLAELEIDSQPLTRCEKSFSPDEFKKRGDLISDAKTFYRELRRNGNQYGPRFQNVSAVWRCGDEIMGEIALGKDFSQSDRRHLHPILLDSVTQVLGAFALEKEKTYILKSIDRIEIREASFPDRFWVRATRHPAPDDESGDLTADIDVFDESGKCCMELDGVAFAFMERVTAATTETRNELEICIASTFTAEPVEDTLRFWGDHFGLSTQVRFAPYNQVFQQLLDSGSGFHKNSDGVNAILLNLKDWAEKDRKSELGLDRAKSEKYFDGHARYVLPNGLEIVHLHQYETDYLYKEIFRDQSYLRHGIRVQDGDTVMDIGANIGLFSLFVLSRCQNPCIYAFEPSPVVFELLKANCEAYGSHVRCFQCGVSDRAREAAFTFYENSSVFSSFHSDTSEDRKAIETVVRNALGSEADEESLGSFVAELTTNRLRQRTYQCRMISVSDIIREDRIEKIHLLKIDAEKSELEILAGIAGEHWPLIDQIVVEVHDRTKQAVEEVERLLIDKGFRCAVEEEKLLENSGLFNIYATRLVPGSPDSKRLAREASSSLERNVDEFSAALSAFMAQSAVPMVLCICPRSREAGHNEALDAVEKELLSRTKKIANVHSISSRSILDRHPLPEYHDPLGDQLGHVPYTAEGYVAIGTTLFQTIFQLENKPLKVIVIDCDHTLWDGVCGEDGPLGIQFRQSHRLLQEFVLEQMKSGLLICICSKNNEKDVLEVFDRRKEMILRREHLASWRINWNRKSESIKALAEELNLGLESFLFIDNDPVECADVRINCPDVLTLQLPGDGKKIPSFLSGIWGLDNAFLTQEDQKRTEMYQQGIDREQFRQRTVSLKDFLDGLQLRIELFVPRPNQIARVSQLTIRTNQFNLTTIRRSENEIRNWLEKGNRECLVASVSDRFGDYGLVGVLLYETAADYLKVDTFLLSCRVLGRGVEHYLLSQLGRKAKEQGKKFVELNYLPTEKNSPACEFIKSLEADHMSESKEGALTIKVRTKTLASLKYDPDKTVQSHTEEQTTKIKTQPAGHGKSRWGNFNRSEKLQKIAEELSDINRIAKAVENYRCGEKSVEAQDEIGPADTVEKIISNIWKKVLARREIGMNDNFFEAGGTSLKAVQLIALLQKELKRTFSITTLFECPTINLLSAKLMGRVDSSANGVGITEARRRGQQRRQVRAIRKAAMR
jgi:FkbH-like protein/FkbM family methyltransferase